jgi:hypothetical protein
MQRVSYVYTLSYTTSTAEDLARCILEAPDNVNGYQHGNHNFTFPFSRIPQYLSGKRCVAGFFVRNLGLLQENQQLFRGIYSECEGSEREGVYGIKGADP